ncbi:uncharacterized protein G2W53_044519 [Senna tora]|uniref:Uncharacterized protein n=1 Tax=Senna tora TaxID=362788 RepID=A0A834SDM2_9FABA|nr:uncharacterized protein G2W53_044519 [Senna tora]
METRHSPISCSAPFREIKFSVACVALHRVRCSVTTEPMAVLLCWKFLNSESGASLSSTTSRGRDPKPQPSVYFLLASPCSHLIAAAADWGFWGWKKHAATKLKSHMLEPQRQTIQM